MNKWLGLSFIVSILGILVLFFISSFIQPQDVSNYNQLKAGRFVMVSGKVVSIRSYNDFSIIRLDNNISLTCNCKFSVNDSIYVEGMVEEYKNELQIQANKITLEEK